MTAPWESITIPPKTGWWVRKERVGTFEGTYSIDELSNYGAGGIPQYYADTFDRAAGALGSNWVNRLSQSLTIGNDSSAWLNDTTVGHIGVATYVNQLHTNDIRVWGNARSLDATTDMVLGIGGSDKMCWVECYQNSFDIVTTPGWNFTSGAVTRATGTVTNNDWDLVSFERIGTTFKVRLGGETVLEWDDTGGYVPRDSNHHYAAMGVYRSAADTSGGWYNFSACDIPQWRSNTLYSQGTGHYTDDFNRADAANLNTAQTKQGYGWWDLTGTRMGLTGNQLYYGTTGPNIATEVWQGPLTTLDGGVQIDVPVVPTLQY